MLGGRGREAEIGREWDSDTVQGGREGQHMRRCVRGLNELPTKGRRAGGRDREGETERGIQREQGREGNQREQGRDPEREGGVGEEGEGRHDGGYGLRDI